MNRRQFLTGALALALMPRRTLATSASGRDTSGNETTLTLAQAAARPGLLFGSPLFPGDFHSWDVVNEAVRPGASDHLTPCIWSKQLGVEYLDYAFHVAHHTDHHALLTYNDYGTEADSDASQAKRECVFALLNGMLKRKVPIHAVGLQSHLNGGETFNTLPDWIKRLKSLKLHIFITELDVVDKSFPSDKDERDKLVAKTYCDFLGSALSTREVEIALTWGLADPYSWLQSVPWAKRIDGLPERPLPFGDKMEPTAVFQAMQSAFLNAPRCR